MSEQTPLALEEMKKTEFIDLNEEDSKKVKTSDFKTFKTFFPFHALKLNEATVLMMCVRQHLENAVSQNHTQVKDGHKKHTWLNQKLFDAFRFNSALIIKIAAEEHIKKLKEENTFPKPEREVGMSPALAHPYGETASEKTIEDTEGKRRFQVLPGSET